MSKDKFDWRADELEEVRRQEEKRMYPLGGHDREKTWERYDPDEYGMSDSERAMRMSDEEWEEREEVLKEFVDYE